MRNCMESLSFGLHLQQCGEWFGFWAATPHDQPWCPGTICDNCGRWGVTVDAWLHAGCEPLAAGRVGFETANLFSTRRGSKSWKSKKWFSAKIGLGICIPTLLFCIETSLMIWRLSLCTILLHKRLPIMSSSKNTWDYGRIWTWFVLIGPNPDLHTKKQYVE